MPVSLKYAVVERERRFVLGAMPAGVVETKEITDRYVAGTRLRLREVLAADGTVVRKLSHKVRLGEGPAEVACTNAYLDDHEWGVLAALPSRVLHKSRHTVRRDGWVVVVDQHDDGTLVAEIDDGDADPRPAPAWLDVVRDVSDDERWTGVALASRTGRRGSQPQP